MLRVPLFVSLALSSYTHTLSKAREHTVVFVLLHQLSSSALRKELSDYTCCDVLVTRRICSPSRVLRMRLHRAICIIVAYGLFIRFYHIVCCNE